VINVKVKGKKETTKPALFDTKTLKRASKDKEEGQYPNWQQVVPDTSKLAPHKKVGTADTGSLMKLITQAEQVMNERTNSVKLWMDDKGKLGITASGPEIGEFAGGDVRLPFLHLVGPGF
jgi:DNA polymerase III sliding clamp (beta) subunit (PCNA family)